MGVTTLAKAGNSDLEIVQYASLVDRPAAATFGIGKCIVSTATYTIESVSDGTEYYSQGHSASLAARPSAATFGKGVWQVGDDLYVCDGEQYLLLNADGYEKTPGPGENSSIGYDANSVWQHEGKTYVPVVAPTSTEAVWTPNQKTNARVTDVIGTTHTLFAGGTVAMKSAFTGAAIDISVTIASTPTAATINILDNGELDVETLAGYLAKMDGGTYCTVTKIYDQTGNLNHVVKDGSFASLLLDFDPVIGRYVITGSYEQGSAARQMRIPNTVAVARNAFSMLMLGRAINAAGNNTTDIIAVLGDWTAGANPISSWQNDNNGGMQLANNPTGGNQKPISSIVPTLSNFHIAGIVAGASSVVGFSNDIEGSKANTNLNTALAGGWIGSDIGSSSYRNSTFRFVGFAVSDQAITEGQRNLIRTGFYEAFNVAPQNNNQVVLIGDSRFSGAYAKLNNTVATLLPQHIKRKPRVINLSNGSKQTSDMISGTVPTAVSLYKTGAKNIAVVLAGVNDFIVGGKTVEQVITNLATMVSTLQAAGYVVAVISELATTSTTNSANTLLSSLHTAIELNTIGADKIINLYGYSAVTTPATAAYYQDGLHPQAAVHNLIASAIADFVNEYI